MGVPAKRILPYVILGIIEEHGQLSGKDITKEFTTDIGEFWKSSHSQIYPELRRMTTDRWLAVVPNQDNDLVEASLAHLNERKKRLFSSPQAIRESYGHYLILERAISRQQAQLQWLAGLTPPKKG